MSRTVAFIQARMSSSRFPGKVIEPLQGQPMIVYMACRAQRACLLDDVVVVTSTHASDDPLEAAAAAASLPTFRGELDDVLSRFVGAARAHRADVVVRLTGDCPLVDPAVVDLVIQAQREQQADYASNIDPPSYPDGFDVECCTLDALLRADRHARQGPEREHVTLWMRSEASGLRRCNVRAVADLSHLRLTVDYPDDLEVVRRIAEQAAHDQRFDLYDVLRILAADPQLLTLNPHARNEGLTGPSVQGTPFNGDKP
ncbi:MAG: 3-deoxy-manno-octulosonate cytidylyltransferase [Burkholderiaceae bacterium]|nr:3-deoxy-manno-octulosonate cytidylyltransferase [Burkholderiaceae bacterium]